MRIPRAKTGALRKPAVFILVAGLGLAVVSSSAAPVSQPARKLAKSVPIVSRAVKAGVSPTVRSLSAEPSFPAGSNGALGKNRFLEKRTPIRQLAKGVVTSGDGALQAPARDAVSAPSTVAPLIGSFAGLSQANNTALVGWEIPPDTNGDVGPNHYVQAVNLLVRVFDKTGAPLTPPFGMNSLFANFGSCLSNAGNPIVLYDPLADRWLLSYFTNRDFPPHHQCVAISQTSDPTGAYFLYDFEMPNEALNDQSRFGVWPDGYYMSDVQYIPDPPFPAPPNLDGAGVFAFDRVKMLAGDPAASYIYFNLAAADPRIKGLLPSDLDGLPPPLGTPNVFAYFIARQFGDPEDGLRLFDFHADFANPPSSTFIERPESPVAVASFDVSFLNVPQPPPATTSDNLDVVENRLMYRLQYRTFGTHATLVTNHSVDADPTSASRFAVRYYELRQAPLGSAFVVNEQATFSPNNDHRWMGSAAVDGQGNLCVGYSLSSTTTFPSIAYACRQPADPPGGLGPETVLAAGGGSQIMFGAPVANWGFYSMLAVDPTDECTFWYTNEYYTGTNSEDEPGGTCGPSRPDSDFFRGICWHTRVGSFRVPSCTGAVPLRGTLTGIVTNAETGALVAGVLIRTADGFTRATDASGSYSLPLPPGTYDLAASKEHFLAGAAAGLVVSAGNTTHQDFALVGLPVVRLDSSSIDEGQGGNDNGWIDPSECINLTIAVTNTGPGSATGIVASLSSPTLGVALSNARSAYPDVAPGAVTTNTTPFRLQTSAAFHSGRPIHLNLQVKTSEGSFTAALELPTGAFFSASGPVAIPEPTGFPPNPAPPVDLPITVSGITSAISQVTVTLHVTHIVANQLALSLVGPDGTTVVLHRAGSIFDDLGSNFGTDCPAGSNDTTFDDAAATPVSAGRLPFVGSFRPQEPLAVFSGRSGSAVNGTWRLRAQDFGPLGGTNGSIDCVTISFGSTGPGPGGCGGPLIDLNVDFNRDARTDILFRHQSTGLTGAWFMDGVTRTGTALMTPPVFTDPAWLAVGTRDFNRDGKTDILWRNQATSRVVVSYMDGLTLTSIAPTTPPVLADEDWFIRGTGDFDSDGMPDFLWRNISTGLVGVTFMNGVTVTSATLTTPPGVEDPNWLIVGAGDFNRDGKPDILWRNPSTGEIAVWFMDGVTATGLAATSPAVVADPDWEIVGVGDYDADADPDVLWQNRTTGQVAIWFMDGVTATNQGKTVPPVTGSGWRVVGPK